MKKQESKKMKRSLGTSETTLNNIWIIGVPEREEQEQEIENLSEQIMKENFPNLAKEIDFQEVQKAQSPEEVVPTEEHSKAHHN